MLWVTIYSIWQTNTLLKSWTMYAIKSDYFLNLITSLQLSSKSTARKVGLSSFELFNFCFQEQSKQKAVEPNTGLWGLYSHLLTMSFKPNRLHY